MSDWVIAVFVLFGGYVLSIQISIDRKLGKILELLKEKL